MIEKFKPQDIIAIILVVGCLILKFDGCDGTVAGILVAIVAFYFGLKTVEKKLPVE